MDINSILESQNVSISHDYVEDEVLTILKLNKESLNTEEILCKIYSCIDLTTLNTTDSNSSVMHFTNKVNTASEQYPELPHFASLCIYPRFVHTVKKYLKVNDIQIASVASGFPSSQTFSDIKIAECLKAIENGANELDIVISVGDILDGNYQIAYDEIVAIRKAIGDDIVLKVILETGELKSLSNVKIASIIAIEAGADFIKTSTGKVKENATLEVAFVMCETIKTYLENTGKFVGFKASGGISTVDDALSYASIFSYILGKENLDQRHFRIGASSLANNLTKEILIRKNITYKSNLF